MGNPLTVLAGEAPLDTIRIVAPGPKQPDLSVCRSEFSRLFEAVSVKTGAVYEINCRSHRCDRHKKNWGNMWGTVIGRVLDSIPPDRLLLVNLTTADRIDHTAIKEAMELFIQRLRKQYGTVRYVRIAEMNKKHTLSHFHCIFIFDDYSIPPMPADFAEENKKRKDRKLQELSWPPAMWEHIRESWGDCLERKASTARKTSVVWCQPPKNNTGAAKYAVGYVTGQSGKGKGEDLDDSFTGRKITYSRNFFTVKAMQIWQDFLTELFGPRDPDDRFFWQGRTDPPPRPDLGGLRQADAVWKFANMPVMRQRWAEAQYYREFGQWPPGPAGPYLEITEGEITIAY